MTAGGQGAGNYGAAHPVQQSFAIQRSNLTVTAANASVIFGQPFPSFSVSYSGFVNGDGPTALGGSLAFTAPPAASVPGTYPITPSGLTSTNYSITYVAGTLTISSPGLVALDPGARGSLSTSGNACLAVSGQIYVDSNNAHAITTGQGCGHIGAAVISATGIGYVGGIGSKCCSSPATKKLSAPVPDPMAALTLPAYSGGAWHMPGGSTLSPGNYNGSTHMYSPGVYAGGIEALRQYTSWTSARNLRPGWGRTVDLR